MYKINDTFLETVGLSSMPEAQKAGFLEYAQDEFEMRVGESMSRTLSAAQIEEFGKIIDNDLDTIQRLLNEAGDYRNSVAYRTLLENGGKDGDPETISNFVTAHWLNKNCPNYVQILDDVLAKFRDEIRSQKDAILGA